MTDLERLLCKVNKVTAYHRHGQKIPENALDDLANTQVEIEEHTQQYNSEAIKTIRKALISYRKYLEIQEFSPTEEAQDALAALDSLAVEPSEEAKDLVWKIILLWDNAIEPEEYDKAKDKAAAIITARDERIRRECADRADEIMYGDMYNWELAKMRAAIMGGKE
jgi:hypothetical protein